MGNRLVLVGEEFELVAVRQIGHAQHLAENQFADVDVGTELESQPGVAVILVIPAIGPPSDRDVGVTSPFWS